MSNTCQHCNSTLSAGITVCPKCHAKFDFPVPAGQFSPGTPSFAASSSPEKKVAPGLIVGISLFIAFIGGIALTNARPAAQPPPLPISTPNPTASVTEASSMSSQFAKSAVPATGNLVGSWTSDIVVSGAMHRWSYSFNSDGTFAEQDTDIAAGKTGSGNATYTYANGQVSLIQGGHTQEQASVVWDSNDQFHYRITYNDEPSQIGLNAVFMRQTQSQSPVATTAATPTEAISADDLYLEFENDPAGAQSKYSDLEDKDQPVRIHGVVDDILLYSEVAQVWMRAYGHTMWVRFFFDDYVRIIGLKKGSVVTIQGIFNSGNSSTNYVEFDHCTVVH